MMFLNFNFETYSFVCKYKKTKKYKRLPIIYLESRHLSQFSIYNRFQSSWERDIHHFPLFPTSSYLSRDTYASPDEKFNKIFGPKNYILLTSKVTCCITKVFFGKDIYFVLFLANPLPFLLLRLRRRSWGFETFPPKGKKWESDCWVGGSRWMVLIGRRGERGAYTQSISLYVRERRRRRRGSKSSEITFWCRPRSYS